MLRWREQSQGWRQGAVAVGVSSGGRSDGILLVAVPFGASRRWDPVSVTSLVVVLDRSRRRMWTERADSSASPDISCPVVLACAVHSSVCNIAQAVADSCAGREARDVPVAAHLVRGLFA